MRYARLAAFRLRNPHVVLEGMVFLGKGARLSARPGYGRLIVGPWVHVGELTRLRAHEGTLRIGDRAVFGRDSSVNCYLDVEIGAATLVADWVYICDFDHRGTTRAARRRRSRTRGWSSRRSGSAPAPGWASARPCCGVRRWAGPASWPRTRWPGGGTRTRPSSPACPAGPSRIGPRAASDPPRDPRVWGRSPSPDQVSSTHPPVASGLMDIVVCVKYVPDAQADRTFSRPVTTPRTGWASTGCSASSTSTPSRRRSSWPRPRRNGGESSVTVLTVGPEQAETAIRKSLQMGADKAVHVKDDALHGSDAIATSLVLAQAIEKIGRPDLVLTGMASTDGTMSVVPAMLAERLGLPQVTFASELTVADGQATIRRDGDTSTETVTASLPAVVQRDRPDQRAALPLVQGDHGGQEEAGARCGRSPTSSVAADQVGLAAAWTKVESFAARPAAGEGPARHR